jgi:hypothetical protein
MSYDDDYTEDVDNTDDTNLVKKLRSKIDELSARTKELEAENHKFHSDVRKQSLATMLEQRGYASKVAAFIPADVEITDEGVDSWLSEYGDAFTPVSTPQAEVQKQQETIVVSNAAQAEAVRRMNAVEQGSNGATQINPNDVLQRIEGAKNMDELVAALRG